MARDMASASGRDTAAAGEPGSVKSAMRVLDLFEYLGRWDAEKTHTEIAAELGIPKSSLTQLLKTLVRRGYLDYVAESKGYTIGPSIATLASRSSQGKDIVSIAGQVLEWMMAETQESCALNFLKGDFSEVAAAVTSPHRLVYHMRLGDLAPLYATSGGKALLAFLPQDMLAEYFGRVVFEKVTPNTIDSVERLRDELALVRETGVAFVREEFTPGIAGMARPILSASGHPLASINTAIPVARFNEAMRETSLRTLERAVQRIRQQLRLPG